MCAEEKGFPYYSPSKTALNRTWEVESSQKAGDVSAAVAGSTESSDEGGKMEDDTVGNTPTRVGGESSQSDTEHGQRCELTNSNVRRQIIRPWEDSPTKDSDSALSRNGVTSPPESSLDSITSMPSKGMQRGANSVQTAAEALVAMATPTKEDHHDEEEAMVVDRRTSASPESGRRRRKSVSVMLNDCVATICNGISNSSPPSGQTQVSVDGKGLMELFERIVKGTDGCSVEEMERIHTTYRQLVFRHRMSWQREDLLEVSCLCYLSLLYN